MERDAGGFGDRGPGREHRLPPLVSRSPGANRWAILRRRNGGPRPSQRVTGFRRPELSVPRREGTPLRRGQLSTENQDRGAARYAQGGMMSIEKLFYNRQALTRRMVVPYPKEWIFLLKNWPSASDSIRQIAFEHACFGSLSGPSPRSAHECRAGRGCGCRSDFPFFGAGRRRGRGSARIGFRSSADVVGNPGAARSCRGRSGTKLGELEEE